MPTSDVYALDASGQVLLRDLLSPLFSTLAPGFDAGAEELRVEVETAERTQLTVTCRYLKEGVWKCSPVAEDYQSAITTSRIRILCGMSIAPDVPHQRGGMRIRCWGGVVSVAVEDVATATTETLVFRPKWATFSTNPSS